MSETVELTKELIRRKSVTPEDAGCQALLAKRLAAAGFAIEHLRFGDVDNLWAIHRGGAVRSCASRVIRMSCRPARARSGSPILSSPSCATACSMAAAPRT